MNTGLEGKRTLHDTWVFDRIQLSNGITVWRQKLSRKFDRKGIFQACLPGIGSSCDPEEAPGAAHFFEHAPFLGTENLPSNKEIFAPIEEFDGELNAGTAMFFIRYFCVLPETQLPLAVKTIFELTAKPLFRDEDIIKERGVILAEHRRQNASGDQVIANAVLKAAFGEKSVMGHTVLGTPSSIASMTAGQLKGFFSKHFTTGNLHLIVGGAFAENDKVVELLEASFGKLIQRPATPRAPIPDLSEKRETLVDPMFRRDKLCMGWLFEGNYLYAMGLVMEHLARDMTSPLIMALRHELGAIYEKGWATANFMGGKTLVDVNIPIAAEHFPIAEEIFLKELKKITPEDLMRRQKISQWRRDYAAPHPVGVVKDAAVELAQYGRIKTMHEDEERQDMLTIEEAMNARDMLLNTRPFICEAITG